MSIYCPIVYESKESIKHKGNNSYFYGGNLFRCLIPLLLVQFFFSSHIYFPKLLPPKYVDAESITYESITTYERRGGKIICFKYNTKKERRELLLSARILFLIHLIQTYCVPGEASLPVNEIHDVSNRREDIFFQDFLFQK